MGTKLEGTQKLFFIRTHPYKTRAVKRQRGLSASLSHVANLCEEQRTQKEGNGKLVQT